MNDGRQLIVCCQSQIFATIILVVRPPLYHSFVHPRRQNIRLNWVSPRPTPGRYEQRYPEKTAFSAQLD